LDDDFLVRMRASPPAGDPALDRHRRVQALLHHVDGRREPLEDLSRRYQQRLHAASDDLEATEGLRVVEAALARVPRQDDEFWDLQRRKLRRRTRRRHRRAAAR
jgi:hypothetical protein